MFESENAAKRPIDRDIDDRFASLSDINSVTVRTSLGEYLCMSPLSLSKTLFIMVVTTSSLFYLTEGVISGAIFCSIVGVVRCPLTRSMRKYIVTDISAT